MSKYLNCIHQCIKNKEPLRPSKSGGANIIPQKVREGLPYIVGTTVLIGGGIVAYNKFSKKEAIEMPAEMPAEIDPMMNLSFGPSAPVEDMPEMEITEVTEIEETTDMPEMNPIDDFFNTPLNEEDGQTEMMGAANTVEEQALMESHPLDSGSGLGDGFNLSMDLEVDEGVLM